MLCILKSKWCLLVFIISTIGIFFMVPQTMLHDWYLSLAIIFIITTASSITCIFRNTKERIKLNKKNKKSLLSIILSIFGLAATQVCGLGAPLCGAALGGSIGLTFLPSIAQTFFQRYSVYIIIISIVGQLYSLYILKCWGKNYCLYN